MTVSIKIAFCLFCLLWSIYVETVISTVQLNMVTSGLSSGLSSGLLGLFSALGLGFLGAGLFNWPKESSQWCQRLLNLHITGADLLIILDVIMGIVLVFWIPRLCDELFQNSQEEKFWEFVISTILVIILDIVMLFFCL